MFSQDDIGILMLCSQEGRGVSSGSLVTERIRDADELDKHLGKVSKDDDHDTFIVLLQEYSRGRLRITESAFNSLSRSVDASTQLSDMICSFGVKTTDEERLVHGIASCEQITPCTKNRHEISYCIFYPEKNGRNLRDPWSIRQVGVYHQFKSNFSGSKWILVDLSAHAETGLRDVIESEANRSGPTLHVGLLHSLIVNWTAYIEFLSFELKSHNDKAKFTAILDPGEGGVDILESDLQELHSLEAKIERAHCIIEGCLDIASRCEKHFFGHQLSGDTVSVPKEMAVSLRAYASQMYSHLVTLRTIRRKLDSTKKLISTILTCQNAQPSQSSNRASYKMLEMLVHIADQSRANQEKADSETLKILSVVAIVCLPASLIGTMFYSNLVQTTVDLTDMSKTRLVLITQFWAYVVITVPLMTAMMAWIVHLDRRARKLNSLAKA